MLTAKQLAEVKGCSFQYIQKKIKEGKLQAVETVNSRNRKVYQIPLERRAPTTLVSNAEGADS